MSGAADAARAFVIRDVTDPWDLRALEDVQVDAWGYPDREVLPGTMFRISAATGGVVLAAYPAAGDAQDVPVGLAYGFPARVAGREWHHSHLLAVRPTWRSSGMAVALKLAQRERALAQGYTHMTWTFDPLVARNARLNLGKLGAVARAYHPDWYALSDDRAAAEPADRLMIEWDLTRPSVERPPERAEGAVALAAGETGPGPVAGGLDAERVLVEVPTRPETLTVALRRAWRLALRDALSGYLAGGYEVSGLAREGERAYYVLTRVG
ncbi:putative GNAT superfamily acetyltransferase [Deinococcus metalli]|uniref:Acyl-CoA N-acyltransferase n=1 Tax=Deinococcus metalli TaxID=1141878 RepID=A0A7W8KFX2_9DEIO|nr:acyl-CoA acyltransferase [Deinococcus metalli]MBB5376373.1 putative GNAT superfamily acetyltransferase [Deinococcus metalli]GHF38776.1 acyl-CoA N-acyltransferase [Deinococcus metalli]